MRRKRSSYKGGTHSEWNGDSKHRRKSERTQIRSGKKNKGAKGGTQNVVRESIRETVTSVYTEKEGSRQE